MRKIFMQILLSCKRHLRTNKFTKELYKSLHALKEIPRNRCMCKNIQNKGYELISLIDNIFKKAEITYFIDFGTLLGMIREHGFIKHDLDIDIGVVVDERININMVRNILVKNGFVLKYEYIFINMNVEDSFIYEGIKIDINYYKNDDMSSKCWLFYRNPDNTYDENHFDVVEMKYSKISETRTIKINDTEMEIPVNAENILAEKYGVNWNVADKNWVYWKAPTATCCDEVGYCIISN